MNWRRPISLALSAVLALSLAAPAMAEDLLIAPGPQTPWYAEAEAYVTEKGLMTGTENGFQPDGIVTRATVFQTLFNMEGKPAEGIEKAAFNDIEGVWYADAAHWAGFTGVATGDGSGAFNGDRDITRAEIVTILYRYAQLKDMDVTAGENTNILSYDGAIGMAEWCVPAFQWACGVGVISGKTRVHPTTGENVTVLDPDATAIRAELATMLMKLGTLAPAATYVEETVSYASDGRTVPAVVTLPVGEGPFPAIVINHGHGGNKDENVGFVGIARTLAEAGFASIRMDFAGCGDSQAPFTQNTLSNMEADSNAGLAYLTENYSIDADRLGILGYSMGGRLALGIISRENNPYQAAVILAGAAFPGKEAIAGVLSEGVTVEEAMATAKEKGSYDYTTQFGQELSLSEEWFTDMMVDPLAEIDNYTGPMLVIYGDKDVVVPQEVNKLTLAAYPAAQEIVVPDADHGYGFYSDQPQVTEMVETSIADFFALSLYPTVALESYLETSGQEWFLTGKTEYTIQGMMVSKETSFHNPLEVTDYTVTDDGVSVVLKGTSGEQWVSKLDKVLNTYTKADGSALTAKDFAKKDAFIDLKTKAEPDTNFAMFVPAGTSVTVNTAWGDVLHTNLPNAPHGEGDYLVCRVGEDGQPDLTDVWVVNGAVFPSTYTLPTATVTGAVTEIEKYGHAVLDVTIADFEALGYALGDIVTVTAGDYTADMPYLDGYYVNSGEAMLRAYPGKDHLAVCINYGKFNEVAKVDVGSEITISLKEKAGALALQATYSLKYTNDRADYATDEIFANFRGVTLGDIAPGKLYRSASPVNDENSRAATADKLIAAAGVKTVMNLADTDEEIAEYIAAEGFASDYYKGLVDAKAVIALGMPVNYTSDEFAEGIVKGLTFLAQNEAPYLVHCTEGKDRAGFTAALLEALMGASLEEIVADYMTSYVNYYHIETTDDKYELIANGNVLEMLRAIAGLEKDADLTGVDLAKAAESYLTGHGMDAKDITALKANLKG